MKINDLFKTVEVECDGVRITIATDLTYAESSERSKIADAKEWSTYTYLKLIKSWNLEGEDGKPLPITKESLDLLPDRVIYAVMAKIKQLTQEREEKKTT